MTQSCSPHPPSPLSLSLFSLAAAFAARQAGRSPLQHWGPTPPYSPSSRGEFPSPAGRVTLLAYLWFLDLRGSPPVSWGSSEPSEPLTMEPPQLALPVETRASPSHSKPLVTFPKAWVLTTLLSPHWMPLSHLLKGLILCPEHPPSVACSPWESWTAAVRLGHWPVAAAEGAKIQARPPCLPSPGMNSDSGQQTSCCATGRWAPHLGGEGGNRLLPWGRPSCGA